MKTILVVPEAALRDEKSVEMLRVFIAEKSLWCSLNIGIYKDSGIAEEDAWGRILADASRHIANALAADSGARAQDVLQRLQDGYTNELADPTTEVKGGFVTSAN